MLGAFLGYSEGEGVAVFRVLWNVGMRTRALPILRWSAGPARPHQEQGQLLAGRHPGWKRQPQGKTA